MIHRQISPQLHSSWYTGLVALLLLILFAGQLQAQTATLSGWITDAEQRPIEGVSITFLNSGVSSDAMGYFKCDIPTDKPVTLRWRHVAYQTVEKRVHATEGAQLKLSLEMVLKIEEIAEVVVAQSPNNPKGQVRINAAQLVNIPGANQGVATVLTTLPGVNSNNELSTQYKVRGGNFDENLVYVNGIEVYRPFLIRSGQQEGLSFVNSDLVENVRFSAGGFQAKYGDKLSSVLDIQYRTPTKFSSRFRASLLGGSMAVEGSMFNQKLRALLGIRYRNNRLFVNSKDTKGAYKPNFTDVQTAFTYLLNKRFSLDFIGNFSLNNYNHSPKTRRTKFGTFDRPLELIVYYQGQEKDRFKTLFGALRGNYQPSEHLQTSLSHSIYHTSESEFFDILAQYQLGQVNNDFGADAFGEVMYSQNIGGQLNHARNELDALINQTALKATYQKEGHQIDLGLSFKYEDIRDRIKEWEVIDSVGFSLRPPHHTANHQPYEAFTGDISPLQHILSQHKTQLARFSWFIQYSRQAYWQKHQVWFNVGLRSQQWRVKGIGLEEAHNQVRSLRAQIAIKPDWEKEMRFRLSGGLYAQPPFYKELRNHQGMLVPNVGAQKSIHVVLANDYSFELWNRPFKLISEAYYKQLYDVNTYTVDNVRIRYAANNNATAYASGLDLRLNGEFVPGTESWVSMGFLQTEENSQERGYIPRPTDQRFKFGMLFQDYVPGIPNIKMYLNLVYNTGVPGGAPAYTDPYDYLRRLNDYKRADIGISYVLKDPQSKVSAPWLDGFEECTVGFEIFNMFDIKNAITNTWVRDAYSKQFYGIPNYMTQRVFNLKIAFKI